MSVARLPQELVDHILDHLHADHAALTSCSLVAHAWRPASLFHLFARLTLKQTPAAGPADLCRRLCRLLDSSPAIAAYIRELDVLEGSQLGTQVAPHAVLAGAQSLVWATTDPTLPHILRRLTRLRRLDFTAQSATIHCARMPPPNRAAVRHTLARPSLTHLRLAFWSFPSFHDLAALLACCTHLRDLSLANISFADPVTDDDPPLPRHKCRLHSLTVEHVSSAPFGDWLLSPHSALDLSALHDLRVALFNDTDFITRLVARAGPSLHTFHFKMGESHRKPPPLPPSPTDTPPARPFDLRTNPNLTTLKLTLEDAASALSWVPALLTHAPCALTHITLEFYTPLKHLVGWSTLDALLARPGPTFAMLSRVDIGLFAREASDEFRGVVDALPALVRCGKARFYRLGVRSQREREDGVARRER